MNTKLKVLENEIHDLISLKTEGSYWDFKEMWHSNKSDLLHDIICMANNLENRDAYIIIGVEDKTGVIRGNLDKDPNRRDQQKIIDFLKDKKFANGIRPTVYMHTINDKDIDIIIIKNTSTTPYYLKEDCEGIYRGNIYTRIGDTNTPKKETADNDKVAYLWRKRFGLDLTPFEKAKLLLKSPKDWLPMGTDGIHTTNIDECKRVWFNKHFPEYTLSYSPKHFDGVIESEASFCSINKVDQNFYWLASIPTGGELGNTRLHNTYYWVLTVKYANAILYATPMITADNFRFERVQW